MEDLNSEVQKKIMDYIQLLVQWNKTYNLTAIREPQKIETHHILDSLSILPYIRGRYCLDVGSGAGFPGIPLALSLPEKEFILSECNRKKASFLKHVVQRLVLKNVKVAHERIEHYDPPHTIDTIMARAFSSVGDTLSKVRSLCGRQTRVLLMKGKYPAQELEGLPKGFRLLGVYPLIIPKLNEARSLVECALI